MSSGLTMYDSVTVSEIPKDAEAVAGYVNGRWPTFPVLQEGWPHAHKLSIAVTASADAECLDVESGDATPGEAPAWVRRQQKRGVKRPVVYASVSQMPAVLSELRRNGIPRVDVRVWTAHYTFRTHLCSAKCWPGLAFVADATQYTDQALGRNLDASHCAPWFFPPAPSPWTKKRLRAWILQRVGRGWSWRRVKATWQWVRFRKLGGR